MSLAEKMVAGGVVNRGLNFIGQKVLRGLTDSPDALTNAAIDRLRSPDGIVLEPRANSFARGVSGLGSGLQGADRLCSAHHSQLTHSSSRQRTRTISSAEAYGPTSP